jgi:hypothetical protein
MVQFAGAHFGGLIAGEYLFILFSSVTCSKLTLQYHLISLFMGCSSTLHVATPEGVFLFLETPVRVFFLKASSIYSFSRFRSNITPPWCGRCSLQSLF